MDIITQQAIIQTCQNSLLAYSSFTNKNYSIQPHHRVIAQVLQEVEQGKRKKVMFFMPPRFGKSEIASINFPAWYLGRNPENALLLCSYGADLANEFSRKARNRFASTEHGIIFDSRLASDSASASEWHTDKGWGMASAGVDGAITGKWWHCLAKWTKIDTINGIREIQDIQSGDFVLSYNHTTNEQEYKRVIATRTSTTRRMYTLTATSWRVIKTTREHEIFIIWQWYKEMVKCKKNESIIIHKSTSYLLGLFSWIREACLWNTKGLKDWYKTIFLQSSVSVSSFLMTQMQKMQNKFSRTSQEFESKKQWWVKSNNGLQTLSYHPSQVESDSISSIISIETDETVYDIEVESNNNLFANGILVHNCLITDDPVKNQLEADSPLKRQRTWDWYNSDFRSRKMDDQSAEIVMLTRWHMDDLAWRLLAAEDDWYVVKVPALRKNGESNWPERFSSEYFETVKKQGWPRIWASLYMQDPKPLGGGLFKREYFKYYSQMQLDTRALDITKMQRYTFMDPAISMKQTADRISST